MDDAQSNSFYSLTHLSSSPDSRGLLQKQLPEVTNENTSNKNEGHDKNESDLSSENKSKNKNQSHEP
jgi:hypothetical protein